MAIRYKKNAPEVFNRLRSLYGERDQSKIFATMDIPNQEIKRFKENNRSGVCNYPDPNKRILFWDKVFRERINLFDDSIPGVTLNELQEGFYGGLFGAMLVFLSDPETGFISCSCGPVLDDLSGLDYLKFNKNHEWYIKYINQLKIFVKGAGDKFGVRNFCIIDSLNFIFLLIGATKAYYSLVDQPELVQKAIDFAYKLNIEIQKDFFDIALLVSNGTCVADAEWVPGRIVSESVDPFHMTSVEYFEKWGREPIERIFSKFDGGTTHIHGNGRHLLKAVSEIKGLKAIILYDDGAFQPAADILGEIKKITGSIPLIIQVSYGDFCKNFEKHKLAGGILYRISQVPDIDCANRLMEKIWKYRV